MFDFRQRHEIFFYSTASRSTLKPTQSPVRGVREVISSGVERPGRETDHSPPCSSEVKNGEAVPPHSLNSSRIRT
jgi:hypothetical protein